MLFAEHLRGLCADFGILVIEQPQQRFNGKPSFTATDDAEGRCRSSVAIRPFVRIKSAPIDGVDVCGFMAHPPSAKAALAPESCVMNDRRLTIAVIPQPLRRLATRAA